MVKVATTRIRLIVPTPFWVSLLVLNTVMAVLPLKAVNAQAIADAKIQNTVASPVAPQEAEAVRVSTDSATETLTIDDVNSVPEYTADELGNTNKVMSQVTSVSQLADVQPTDWAFQALQSLVERYGCIAGYPDGTYRGKRALSRYEFAAGLNACLDRALQKR